MSEHPTIEEIGREPIDSSNILSIGYSAARSTLAIEFKSGDVWHYAPISLEQATEFYTAPSKGKHYTQFIKGKIAGNKVTGPCNRCGTKGTIGTPCACGGVHHQEEKRYGEPGEARARA